METGRVHNGSLRYAYVLYIMDIFSILSIQQRAMMTIKNGLTTNMWKTLPFYLELINQL
jgi:hypothetical protein